MDKLRIQGASQLRGTVRASGAKNASLPVLAASLLSDQPLILSRVPQVRDIGTMCSLLEHLGVSTERDLNGELRLHSVRQPETDEAPYQLVKTMRASVLVLGPLLARLGHARVSLPGGCAIGVRPIDQHLAGFEALGAKVTLEHGYVTATAQRLQGTRYRFSVPTVGGTENLMLGASLAKGTTVLENCAREPEIEDLANLLSKMGAAIHGAGTPTIEIEGVESLSGCSHTVIADRIEAGTYLVGGALTDGDVTVEGVNPEHLAPLLTALEECHCQVTADTDTIRVRRGECLVGTEIVTAPHPGFPTDLQAQLMVLTTQAQGVSRIHEAVFENRFQHVPELARMGADIRIEGNHAVVHGPTLLSGAKVMATDLRASASLVLAGIVAQGQTVVDRIYHLDRGYEAIEDKLAQLGAQVERVSS